MPAVVGGGGGAEVVSVSDRSNTRSLDAPSAWWTSTAITLSPDISAPRNVVQSRAAYVLPASWPMASLEAQAVAARTYAVYSIVHYGLRADCACHLTDGSGDQTYIGYDRASGTDGNRWVKAVSATRGRVVTYHGFGGRMPACCDLIRVDLTLAGGLRLWKKNTEA